MCVQCGVVTSVHHRRSRLQLRQSSLFKPATMAARYPIATNSFGPVLSRVEIFYVSVN